MANHYSALKRVREEVKRTLYNRQAKTRLRHQLRAMRRLLAAKNVEGATAALPQTFSQVDRSANNGLIKKNTAARYKSKMHLKLKVLAGTAQPKA